MRVLAENPLHKTTSAFHMPAALEQQSFGTPGPLARIMLVYIVVVVGRIGDIVPAIHNFPLAKIIAALAVIVALQNRATLAPISIRSLRPAKLTFLIMSLASVSILFSVLRHATLNVITGTVLSVCVGFVLTIKSARNWRSVRLLLIGCVLSALVLCFTVELTRFAGRAGDTRDLDPNDFAFVLNGLLPIAVSFAVVSRGFGRLLYAGLSSWIVLEILRTESRGGLLGLLCVVVLMIVLLPGSRHGRLVAQPSKTRVVLRIAAVIMAGILTWHVIPQSARARFETLRHPESGYNTNLKDRSGRFAIWSQTLPLALRRPWGWGAGAFEAADGIYGGGVYMAAHNMYLQALIELGALGLALFLAVLASSFSRLKREAFAQPEPLDPDGLERRTFARAMIASLSGLCISGFFLAELYQQVLWMLIVLSCLVGRSLESRGDALPGINSPVPHRNVR